MSEKKGNTVKIEYGFDTWKCLEIYVESLERWHRVTAREFRSYSGKRRVTTWDKEDNPIYTEHNGPIYYFMTNNVCKEPDGNKVQHLVTLEKMKPRMFEEYALASQE